MQQPESRKVSKTYDVATTSTLVDLNQDIANFIADFKVYPTDKTKTYKIAVVDQTHIDNSEIDYKDVTGDMGATVSWDEGVYKNHYIALKSAEPMQINVDIELKEIPKKSKTTQQDSTENTQESEQYPYQNKGGRFQEVEDQDEDNVGSVSKSKNIWFKISIVCLAIIGVVLLWKYFNKSKTQTDTLYNPPPPSVQSTRPSPQVENYEYDTPSSNREGREYRFRGSETRDDNNPIENATTGQDTLSKRLFSKYGKNYAF